MAASTRSKTNEARAQELLLWARRHQFGVQHVTVGDVSLTCVDLAPNNGASKTKRRGAAIEPKEKSVYAEMGGEAWDSAVNEAEGRDADDPDLEDKDDDDGE